jgi:hypothetical protein
VPPQEAHDYSTRAAVVGADRPDAADVPTDKSATAGERVAPPRELNQDEAADVMRGSRPREARVRSSRADGVDKRAEWQTSSKMDIQRPRSMNHQGQHDR